MSSSPFLPELSLLHLDRLVREVLVLVVHGLEVDLLVVDELVKPPQRDRNLDHADDHERQHGHWNADDVDVGQGHEGSLSRQLLKAWIYKLG